MVDYISLWIDKVVWDIYLKRIYMIKPESHPNIYLLNIFFKTWKNFDKIKKETTSGGFFSYLRKSFLSLKSFMSQINVWMSPKLYHICIFWVEIIYATLSACNNSLFNLIFFQTGVFCVAKIILIYYNPS